MTPRFLEKNEVLTLHRVSIQAYGGQDGLLDDGKLEAALAMPRQTAFGRFVHEFPFEMAAAYAYHLALGHAFVDGNKRTAFAACAVFLTLNGWTLQVHDDEGAGLILGIIEHRRDKAWVAGVLQANSTPIDTTS